MDPTNKPEPDSETALFDFASKGGTARAKSLTSAERSEIARKASEARWRKLGKPSAVVRQATHAGVLKLGDIQLACAVLDDGTRVISERGFLAGIGLTFGGGLSAARNTTDGAAKLPMFVAYKVLNEFISPDLTVLLSQPVLYRPIHGGKPAHGLRAELVPKVCNVWLKARDANKLTKHQRAVAANADILMRGLAEVAIAALIDEATGYQDDRDRWALAKILEAFVAKELRPWVHTFPSDYYREMYRVRGLTYPPARNRMPQYFGRLTNDVVYSRLAPGVLNELRRVTPRDEKGRLKQHLHRRLTDDVGHPKLLQHLGAVVAIMKVSDNNNWPEFIRVLNKHYPIQSPMPLFDEQMKTNAIVKVPSGH